MNSPKVCTLVKKFLHILIVYIYLLVFKDMYSCTFHTFSVHVLPSIVINISFNDMQVVETWQEFKHSSIFKCQTCHIHVHDVHTSFLAWPHVFVYCLPSVQWYSNVKKIIECVLYIPCKCHAINCKCIHVYLYMSTSTN